MIDNVAMANTDFLPWHLFPHLLEVAEGRQFYMGIAHAIDALDAAGGWAKGSRESIYIRRTEQRVLAN
jgi:hypothetical protein